MASSKEIRGKIKSVENTKKITKAMEMVAASKMRKAQDRMRHARPYADKVRNIAAHLANANPEYRHPFLVKRESMKGAGLVRSKRGVGGGYILARPPAEISLAEIVGAVDGPIAAGDFGEPHANGACDHEGQCVLLTVWHDVGGHMRRLLEGYTLAHLAEVARGERPWPGA